MSLNRHGGRRHRVAAVAAVVGASAVVALGALTVALHDEQAAGGDVHNVSGGGSMSLGNTATGVPAAATSLETSVAVPPVKATQFGES